MDRHGRDDGTGARDPVAGLAARQRVHARARRGRPSLHADDPAGPVDRRRARPAAADRQADPHRARGRARVRQGGARGVGDRPGPDRNVRDDDQAEAARPVAARHDPGETEGGARCAGEVPGSVERLGLSHQDAHRHARHRNPHARRHQDHGTRSRHDPGTRPAHRGHPARSPRHDLRVRRAHRHRPLHRRGHRPGRGRALWTQRQGRAGHRRQRGRWDDREQYRRGAGALSHQPALSAGLPRFAGEAAGPAGRDADGGERDPRRRRDRDVHPHRR